MTSTDEHPITQYRLPGANRARAFAEPEDVTAAPAPPSQVASAPLVPVAVSVGYRPPVVKESPAEFGRRARVLRILSFGLAKPKPGREEQEFRNNNQIIREGHWAKSVRIGVVSPKGSSMKTPTALILGGVLASQRGGSVAIWDACDAAGTLHDRAGGHQLRCVSDIALHPEQFPDPATVSSCAATQRSFADVLGSLSEREFTRESVEAVTGVLDVAYRIQVADTANTPHSSAYQAVLELADILVIPTTLTADSINKALSLIRRVQDGQDHLSQHAVVVLSRFGGPVTVAEAHKLFSGVGIGAVVEVPYDPHIAAGVEIDPTELSHESKLAWTRVAATVVANAAVN